MVSSGQAKGWFTSTKLICEKGWCLTAFWEAGKCIVCQLFGSSKWAGQARVCVSPSDTKANWKRGQKWNSCSAQPHSKILWVSLKHLLMDPSSPPLPRVTIHLLFQLQGGTWLGVTGKSFWPRSTCRGCVQPHGIWQGWNHSSLLQSGIVQLVIASWLPFSERLQDVIPNWTEIHPVHLCTWHGKELRCCSRGPASKWSKVRNLHAGNYIETWQEPGLTVAAAETEDTW